MITDETGTPTAGQERVESWAIGVVRLLRLILPRPGMLAALQLSRGHVSMMLQESGISALEHKREKCSFEAGQWTFWSADAVRSVHVQSHATGTQWLAVEVPRKDLADAEDESAPGNVRILRYEDRPLLQTIRDLAAVRGRLDATSSSHIGMLLVRVMKCVIGEERRAQRAAASSNPARLNRVRQYILEHVQDPQLSLAEIAGHAGCSKRFVQMMFAECGETVTQFVLRSRLERVHCMLLSSGLEITEIAVANGFNDHSYFGRAYRGLFGMSPSSARRAHRVVCAQRDT